MGKKTKLADVALAARVSVATVSRLATGSARVNPELAERVKKAALDLGVDLYGGGKSKVIAFLLSNRAMLHPFHSHVLVGAESYSAAHEWNMLFLTLRYPVNISWQQIHLPQILERRDMVGGVIVGGTNTQNLLDLLKQKDIPFVVLGNNVLGEWQSELYDAVWFDDIQGAYETTQYLQELGHRDIWYVGNCRLTWYARRCEGYRRAMKEAGLRARVSEFDSADDAQLGYLASKSILSGNEPISAIFAGGDQAAQGVCKSLREKGLRVPEDVSVAGFNDIEAAMWHPPLTSVQVFPEQISKRMVELLMKRIEHRGIPPQQTLIPTQLIKRESCDRCFRVQALAPGESGTEATTRNL